MKYELIISHKDFKTEEPQIVKEFKNTLEAIKQGTKLRKKYKDEYMFVNVIDDSGKLVKTEFVKFEIKEE